MLSTVRRLGAVKVKKSESVHLRLAVELYQQVREIARAERRTITNTINWLLAEAIEQRKDGER